MANKRLSKNEAARQMAAADNRIKGISSIADNTVRRSKIDLKKQYGTASGQRQAVTSVDKALNSLAKTTDALAKGVKTITVETARGVKNITASGAKAMNEYARAITEDIHINRKNFMVTTIGKFTPLVGYAVAKMMETTVFRNMIDRMKVGLGKALDSVTSRFKRLASMGWEKGKEFWNSAMDRISGKRGAVKTRMATARQAKKDKRYITKEAAIKDALSDAKVAAAARKASRTKSIEKEVPHMASGGYVKKEGLAKVHAAEVVQPVDKIVETIVDTVNKRLDAKEEKQKKSMFEGTMFERGKDKDFFGFDKIGKSIKSGMDIMFRKNLALEQRVMKRDKKNQQGLIGSFMTAYSQEAKQEELPLMERQVRAILELKNTISGDQKVRQAAWNKMLYEHPVFHAMFLAAKGSIKAFVSPMKFLLRKRGVYASKLSTRGTVFERLVDASSQTFQGLMSKLDDVIHNTFLIAGSSHASAQKAGASDTKSGGKKAPGQAGYSIAGAIARLAYKGAVKYPGKAIEWMIKKAAGKDLDKEKFEKWSKKRKWLGDEGELKKKRTIGGEGDLFKLARMGINFGAGGKGAGGMNLTDAWKNIKGSVLGEGDKKRAKKIAAEEKKSASNIKKLQQERDNLKYKDFIRSGLTEEQANKKMQRVINKREKAEKKKTDREAHIEIRNKDRKRKFDSSMYQAKKQDTKDRTGKTTIFGKISELAKTAKTSLKGDVKGRIDNSKVLTKLAKGAGTLWKWAGLAITWMMTLPSKIGGWLSMGLKSLGGFGKLAASFGPILGGAISIALAGAAGAAIGTLLNKYVVTPFTDKLYAESDKRNKEAYTSGDLNLKGYDAVKEYQRGGGSKEAAIAGNALAKASSGIGRAHTTAKSGFGLFHGVNFPRVTGAQQTYLREHVGDYIQYGPTQVDALRAKWNKHRIFGRGKTLGKSETWEQYGTRREESFLKYLIKFGKPLTDDELDAETGNVVRRRDNVAQEKIPSSTGLPIGSKATALGDIKSFESKQKRDQVSIATLGFKGARSRALKDIRTADNPYFNISKSTAARFNKIQSTLVDYMPVLTQFSGSTAVSLGSMELTKYFNNNPTVMAKSVDGALGAAKDIAKFSKSEWLQMKGVESVYDAAVLVNKKRSKIKAATSDFLRSVKENKTFKTIKSGVAKTKEYAKSKYEANTTEEQRKSVSAATGAIKSSVGGVTGALGQYSDESGLTKFTGGVVQKGKDLGTKGINYVKQYDEDRLHKKHASAVSKIKMFEKKQSEKKEKLAGYREIAENMWSKGKMKFEDLKTNLPMMIKTMGDNLVTTFLKMQDFFTEAYGNPKEYYTNTKNKVWGGITKTYRELHNMYLLMKWDAEYKYDQLVHGRTSDYEAPPIAAKVSAGAGVGFKFPGPKGQATSISITGHGGEVGFISPTDVQERLGIMSGMNGKQVAAMGARKELFRAALQNGMLNGLQGVKDSVDMGTKANVATIHTVINQTSNASVSNTQNQSGGSQGLQNQLADCTRQILTGNVS